MAISRAPPSPAVVIYWPWLFCTGWRGLLRLDYLHNLHNRAISLWTSMLKVRPSFTSFCFRDVYCSIHLEKLPKFSSFFLPISSFFFLFYPLLFLIIVCIARSFLNSSAMVLKCLWKHLYLILSAEIRSFFYNRIRSKHL